MPQAKARAKSMMKRPSTGTGTGEAWGKDGGEGDAGSAQYTAPVAWKEQEFGASRR